MNKSIVYFFVLSSFLVGCGQGFDGNLSPAKDLSPFGEENNSDSQQQADTTRPNTLPTSSDEEGVHVIYNTDDNVDGNYNNTPKPGTITYVIPKSDNEIAVQGGNWSKNNKLDKSAQTDSSTDDATQTLNETEDASISVATAENDSSETKKPTANSWSTDTPTAKTKVVNNEIKVQADNWRSNTVEISKQEAVSASKCSSIKLFDNHQENILKHIKYLEKGLVAKKVSSKTYDIDYEIDCESLNTNAGTIYNNLKNISNAHIKYLSHGRPSVTTVSIAFANIIKSKVSKSEQPIKITIDTDATLDVSSISAKELANEIKVSKNTIPVLIGSEEALKLWVDAIQILTK